MEDIESSKIVATLVHDNKTVEYQPPMSIIQLHYYEFIRMISMNCFV